MNTTKTTKTDPRSRKRRKDRPAKAVQFVYHPSFSLPQAARRLWGPDRERIRVAPYSLMPQVDAEAEAVSAKRTNLSRDQEKLLFLRYNYAKYRLSKLVGGAGSPRQHKQAEKWRKRARATREKIVHANLPLVPAMAKRKRVEGVDFADKVAEGYLAVLRSIEYFDASRGFKFSTYACRAILAALYRLGSKAQTYRKHVPVQYDPSMEKDDYGDRRHAKERDDAMDSVRQVLQRNTAELSDVQQQVIHHRFPIGSERGPEPLWKVGRQLGVSTERARQIEKASLRKLGAALDAVLLT